MCPSPRVGVRSGAWQRLSWEWGQETRSTLPGEGPMGLDWPAVWSFLPSKDGMRSVSQEAGSSDLRGSA